MLGWLGEMMKYLKKVFAEYITVKAHRHDMNNACTE